MVANFIVWGKCYCSNIAILYQKIKLFYLCFVELYPTKERGFEEESLKKKEGGEEKEDRTENMIPLWILLLVGNFQIKNSALSAITSQYVVYTTYSTYLYQQRFLFFKSLLCGFHSKLL